MMYGANLEDMERLAQVVQQAAGCLDRETHDINTLVQNSQWQGRDAEQFLLLWSSVLLGQLKSVVGAFGEMVGGIQKQLKEQDDASAPDSPPNSWGAFGESIGRVAREVAKSALTEVRRQAAVNSFLKAYPVGKPVEYNGDARYGRGYEYQCVDYGQAYTGHIFHLEPGEVRAVLGGGNASALFGQANPDYFDKIPSTEPVKVGDIVCMGGGKYGHVAVVTKVNDDGSYLVADQNGLAATDAGRSPKIHRLSEWQLRHVQGYLRPKADKIKIELPAS